MIPSGDTSRVLIRKPMPGGLGPRLFLTLSKRRRSVSGSSVTKKTSRAAATKAEAPSESMNSVCLVCLWRMRDADHADAKLSSEVADRFEYAAHVRCAMAVDHAHVGGNCIDDDKRRVADLGDSRAKHGEIMALVPFKLRPFAGNPWGSVS